MSIIIRTLKKSIIKDNLDMLAMLLIFLLYFFLFEVTQTVSCIMLGKNFITYSELHFLHYFLVTVFLCIWYNGNTTPLDRALYT